jgi:competence protein ComEA
MLKKLLMLFVALSLSLTAAWAAAVEVNTADQAALESVKGLGPVKSKAIIDERTKNGPFKDADDLASRVKGLGTKSVTNLEAAGLTIGGASTPPTGAKAKTQAAKPAATAPAATTTAATSTAPAPTPATAASDAGGKPAKASRASKKKAAAVANAASDASAPADASAPKAKSTKKGRKAKAASAAAASGA